MSIHNLLRGEAPARQIAHALAARGLDVCRHYLDNGSRSGAYWRVGDVTNTPGQSLFVRLVGSASRPPGKWTDAATGEHGDLLDLIRLNRNLGSLRETLAEARRFLDLPAVPERAPCVASRDRDAPRDPGRAAQRLFHAAMPIPGTLASAYLRQRGLTGLIARRDAACRPDTLRFHPACYQRENGRIRTFPALLCAARDGEGRMTGILRTWLASDGLGKADLADPRKALGTIHGAPASLGPPAEVMAAGEGLETMLSIRLLLPGLPCRAALAAGHLSAIPLPAALRRLYIAPDDDAAGWQAAEVLHQRASVAGIDVRLLAPPAKDWDQALRALGDQLTRAHLLRQLVDADRARVMATPEA